MESVPTQERSRSLDLPLPAGRPPTRPSAPDPVRVAVVVPAYRVESRIVQVVRSIPRWVETIVVVDDGSPDRSAERVAALADPRVELLRHPTNQGVGRAMVTGIRRALDRGAEVIVKMDGDGQMDPARLGELLRPLLEHEADLAKGNRYQHFRSLRRMPPARLVGNSLLTFLVKLASGHWSIFDPANGFLAVRAEVLRRLDLDRLPRRFFFESGLLIELGILGARVQDVAIPARYGDEVSSLSVWRTLFEFPPRLLWGLCRRLFRHYFLYDFTAVSLMLLSGLPMLLFGVLFGAYHWYRSIETAVPATTGTVILAALPVILGFQLLLQALTGDIARTPSKPISPPLRGPTGPPTYSSTR